MLLGGNPVATLAKSVNDPLNLSYEDMRIMEALNWTYFEQVRASTCFANFSVMSGSNRF